MRFVLAAIALITLAACSSPTAASDVPQNVTLRVAFVSNHGTGPLRGLQAECEGCAAQIVVGTGRAPIAEHYQPDFEAVVERTNARQLQVNDC